MKLFVLTILFATQAFAADYICRAGFVKFELKGVDVNSFLTVSDVQSGQFHFAGVVRDLEVVGNTTDLIFDTGARDELVLRFKTTALEESATRLFGFARGNYGGGFIDQSLQCVQR